ncbi:lipoprotein-releasing ABC transporter permease subunit [Thalassotalea atypica]|uniref:lipoprotein-releasing ABC transporter permease subunit n=1 Tax=Thalassotalea atypica TaxID=2054316 RepID=UPI0025728EF4|nr:lipoprotein-releasing ABC transporter permease subunit [Thalassotalea atypica]
MFQPVSFFIGLRYSRSQNHSGFISFITFFSIAGILLGVASLITVVSVMNGFEGELKKRILGIVPHVIVEAPTASQLPQDIQTRLLAHPSVVKVTPFVEMEALVQSASQLQGVLVHGLSPELEQTNLVNEHMTLGTLSSLSETPYQAVIGRSLARKLSVNIGDKLRLVLPNKTLFTPMGRIPIQRTFKVSGIFYVGSQIDDSVVYIHTDAANKLQRKKPEQSSQLRIYLDDPFIADGVVNHFKQQFPKLEFTVWKQSQGALFSAVNMEKNMMWLMLSLIVAVAAFNIVSALVMVVNDKQGEIGILQTIGMSRLGIVKIFMTQGLVNGSWGVILGASLGVLLTQALNPIMELFGLNVFGQGYASQQLPIRIEWPDIGVIVLSAFAMSLLATLYPAYRASQTQPAEVLRNE